jgi:ABC-type nitrate/sulfonate/bicarbonate transport system substrate-binding protein
MQKLAFAAVSRNYFNMPVRIAVHQGVFADEGLDVSIELHEGVDEVTNRLRDGRVELAYGYINRDYLNAALHDLAQLPAGSARC